MAGVLRPAGCHRHQVIIRRAVSVIQGTGKSSVPLPRASMVPNGPEACRKRRARGTTIPRKEGCRVMTADAGEARQDTRSRFAIVRGFRVDATLCRCRGRGASFFSPETRFFEPEAAPDGKKLRQENLFRATVRRPSSVPCQPPSERTPSRALARRSSASPAVRPARGWSARHAERPSMCRGSGISRPSAHRRQTLSAAGRRGMLPVDSPSPPRPQRSPRALPRSP